MKRIDQAFILYVTLALVCLVYLGLGVSYAARTPDWQVPDEPAHYNYIRQIAEDGALPVMQPGDWDSEYQGLLVSSGFAPQYLDELARVEFQDHQPPLYYLLAAPIYALTDGDLLALRLLSVAFGLGMLLATFALLRLLFPEQPWLAPLAAGFVVFIPQHLAFLGGVNNDPFANLLVACTLLAVVWYLARPAEAPRLREALVLGVLVGLAFLTKSTIYFLAGIAGLAILLRWRRARWPQATGAQQIAAFLIPALVLGGLWWGRNLDVYGGTDFLGLQQHNEVAAGQLQTTDYIQQAPPAGLGGDLNTYRRNYLFTTFHSFWGQFGWMAVPMPIRLYRVLLGVCVLLGIGSLLYAGQMKWPRRLTAPQQEALVLFALASLLVLAAYLLYNLTFVQFQGRYLYPALVPLAVWVSIGITGWTGLIARWIPGARWAGIVGILALAGLAWYALHTYIVGVFPVWS
ncbi:MAG: DUF2142 domain-containing protein [Anaerolineales bacterium]